MPQFLLPATPEQLVSPRAFKILESFDIPEIERDFEKFILHGWKKQKALVYYQDIQRLFYDDDYRGIDTLVASAGLKLVYEKRQAKKRREFRTKQRRILCGK